MKTNLYTWPLTESGVYGERGHWSRGRLTEVTEKIKNIRARKQSPRASYALRVGYELGILPFLTHLDLPSSSPGVRTGLAVKKSKLHQRSQGGTENPGAVACLKLDGVADVCQAVALFSKASSIKQDAS
jgi:hypothetical protein